MLIIKWYVCVYHVYGCASRLTSVCLCVSICTKCVTIWLYVKLTL